VCSKSVTNRFLFVRNLDRGIEEISSKTYAYTEDNVKLHLNKNLGDRTRFIWLVLKHGDDISGNIKRN